MGPAYERARQLDMWVGRGQALYTTLTDTRDLLRDPATFLRDSLGQMVYDQAFPSRLPRAELEDRYQIAYRWLFDSVEYGTRRISDASPPLVGWIRNSSLTLLDRQLRGIMDTLDLALEDFERYGEEVEQGSAHRSSGNPTPIPRHDRLIPASPGSPIAREVDCSILRDPVRSNDLLARDEAGWLRLTDLCTK